MSIDMNTYGREIRKVIDEVVSDSGNDWCIFGYEGKTYTLKVVAEGEGIEDMVDEFHGSKIMYGYCKVKEPNTGLPKFVFINWQGEGAPERMKFACGSHSSEVQRICRTTHVTVNARDESDVDPKDIISRVVKASGSQHSVIKSSNNAPTTLAAVAGPKPTKPKPGSVYKKVNPTAEILNQERDAYWQKIDAEERRQKAEEENRRRQEKEKQDRELRERDRREAEARERRTSERSQQIAQQRSVERQVDRRMDRQDSEKEDMQAVAMQERERRNRSESLKSERQAELANLIAQRNATGLSPSQKIGSNYQRVDPQKEILSVRRDEYWEKMEQEESKQKEEEKRRRAEENSQMERQRKQREDEETRRREAAERERATAIAQQRQAERDRTAAEKRSAEAQARAIHQEAIADEQERQSRSERLRKERQEEAARLIAQRGGTDNSSGARNFFRQQETSSNEPQPATKREPPRMTTTTAPFRAPEPTHSEPYRAPEPPTPPAPYRVPEPTHSEPYRAPEQTHSAPYRAPEPTHSAPYRAPEPPAPLPAMAPVAAPVSAPAPVDEGIYENLEADGDGWSDDEEKGPAPQDVYEPVDDFADDQGVCAKAVYDYQATEDDEITFNPGDVITNIDKIDDGWWMGTATDGHRGLFPANYVRQL